MSMGTGVWGNFVLVVFVKKNSSNDLLSHIVVTVTAVAITANSSIASATTYTT
jgi:hypothetical protein